MRDNVVELAVLFFVLPVAFWSVAYLLFHQLVANLTWTDGQGVSGSTLDFSSSVSPPSLPQFWPALSGRSLAIICSTRPTLVSQRHSAPRSPLGCSVCRA
jgi:hypothetical protein